MYQSYISDDNILFVRHYGTFVAAETLTAILHALGSHVPNARLKGLYVDLRDVNDVSLEDTDGAFGDYFRRRLASYGQDFRSMSTAKSHNPEDLTLEEIDDIIHSEHVIAEQLNIFAAHASHKTAELKQQITALDEISKRVEARLKELGS